MSALVQACRDNGIFHPESSFTLLDSNGKTRFLFQVKVALNLENVRIEHSRLEHYQPAAPLDIVTCRGVATLQDLTEKLGVLMQGSNPVVRLKGQLAIAEVADLFLALKHWRCKKFRCHFSTSSDIWLPS